MARETALGHVVASDEAPVLSGVFERGHAAFASGWGIVRTTDPKTLTRVPLSEGAVLGTGERASAVVSDQGVSEVHARFVVRADGAYVEALSVDAGLWVDGVRAERMALADGNVIRIGSLLGVFVERELGRYSGHLSQIGDLVFGPRQRAWVDQALGYVRARESFFVEGGEGSGKATLAQAAARSLYPENAVLLIDARSASARTAVLDALGAKIPVLVVRHIDMLDRAAQIELVRVLKRTPSTVLIGTLRRTLEQSLSEGHLAPAMVSHAQNRRVRIPELDVRREDIVAIVHALCERERINSSELTPALLEQFMRGGWPGGIAEMNQVLCDAMALEPDESLRLSHVCMRAARPSTRLPLSVQQEDCGLAKTRLERALDRAGGTIAAAARELRVSRQAFYREIKRLNVELPRKKLREPSQSVV